MMSEELIEDTEIEKSKPDKPDYKFRLSENYAIDTDPRNIILLERYEKQLGKGKNAPKSGVFAWKQIGYFQNFDRIAEVLVDSHLFDNKDETLESLYDMTDRVKTLKKEMKAFLKEKVVVKLD